MLRDFAPPYYSLRDYGTATWEGGDPECDHKHKDQLRGVKPEYKQSTQNGGESARTIYHERCGKCNAVRIDAQIGLESSPQEYIAKLLAVFEEVRRVLRKDGTLWLVLGDSYWGGKGQSGGASPERQAERHASGKSLNKPYQLLTAPKITRLTDMKSNVFKPKDLMGIPWRVAFALQEAGWWLRQDIIWHKPNPMPESVTDRCTKSHEYIFLLTKSARYYFNADAIKEPANYDGRKDTVMKGSPKYANGYAPNITGDTMAGRRHERWQFNEQGKPVRNKRSVWTVATQPYKEAHFAVYPPKLIEPCILAGSREGDIVLDPFAGAGTTLLVARRLNRRSVGIELNPEYAKLIEHRLEHYHKTNAPPLRQDATALPLFGAR